MSQPERPTILFIIASDPRTSHRPAEAIRVAAGVGVWKRADVIVYFSGPAILALGEWVDELKEDDNFTRYLPLLAELGRPFLVPLGAPELMELGETQFRIESISESSLAKLAMGANSIHRF